MLNVISAYVASKWVEWLFVIALTVWGWLYRKILKALNDEKLANHAQRIGVQALLRDRIIAIHDKYMEKGYCPVYIKENVTRLYEPYHSLGGNDVATTMVEDLLALPTKPPMKPEE